VVVMGIEDDDIRKVRDATDIVALISQHLQLRRVGRRWTGLCPFHNEKSPSFSVNDELGVYYCFGCGQKGDAITFVRELEHLDFVGAVEHLAAKANIALTYTNKNEGKDRRRRSQLTDAIELAVDWYHQRLLKSPDAAGARGYLRSRGFDGDEVREYRVGWAPDGWDVFAQSVKMPRDVFVEAGLGFVNKRGRLQDHFRGRVLFPIFDSNGTAVGFGGRILPGGDGPKYKNSGESSVYAKSRLLYGLNWSKDEIVRSGESIICEGYTDVIGFARAGMNRAIATCGTALTEEHVKMLKRFGPRIVLAFDADAAGQAAAERIYEWEQKYDVDVAVAKLPAGVDPADLADEDPEALNMAVTEAQPFLAFRISRVLGAADLSTAEGRARAAQRAVDVVREHPSEIVQDQYLMEVGDVCRVAPDRLRALLAAPPQPDPTPQYRRDEPPPEYIAPEPLVDNTETQMLRLALHDPESIPLFVHAKLFTAPRNRHAFQALLEAETLHQAVEGANSAIAEVLGQLAVLDEPDGESGPLIGQFLYDSARYELRRLQSEARMTDDPDAREDIARRSKGLQTTIPKVLDSAFALDVAEQLVPWLPTTGEEFDQ